MRLRAGSGLVATLIAGAALAPHALTAVALAVGAAVCVGLIAWDILQERKPKATAAGGRLEDNVSTHEFGTPGTFTMTPGSGSAQVKVPAGTRHPGDKHPEDTRRIIARTNRAKG